MEKLTPHEIEELLVEVEPYINYCLLQTGPENREDLKQHLYYKCLYYLSSFEPKLDTALFDR